MKGIYKISLAAPEVHVAQPNENAREILACYDKAKKNGSAILLLPRLALTGCSCGDLFRQPMLLDATLEALATLLQVTKKGGPVLVVGLPLAIANGLYNANAIIQNGAILGISVSNAAPNQFAPGSHLPCTSVNINGQDIPIGTKLQFNDGNVRFSVVDYDDMQSAASSADALALAGTQLFLCPAAIQELPGCGSKLELTIKAASQRLKAAVAVVSTGYGETVSDVLYAGRAATAWDNSYQELAPAYGPQFMQMDFVPAWLDYQRRASNFGYVCQAQQIQIAPLKCTADISGLALKQQPFSFAGWNDEPCTLKEVLDIQAAALARRVKAINAKRLVIGISGGLDSTLALIAAAHCAKMLGEKPDFVLAVTMPGMGTSSRTKNNAGSLAKELGAELWEVSIKEAVLQHFKDIDHSEDNHNVVYENAQARERTQILMDIANEVNGIVLGTGDLSETALGWCTFNGDHISNYALNGSVPKTLIRAILRQGIPGASRKLTKIVNDILDTPVSPELLPGIQNTEDIIGNYDLHDFFLYH
ncbi:MAG: NAD(+) synthase, partial [Victivallales bacterium]|nr:NAD(+) synthase [Victivallales bacterium]